MIIEYRAVSSIGTCMSSIGLFRACHISSFCNRGPSLGEYLKNSRNMRRITDPGTAINSLMQNLNNDNYCGLNMGQIIFLIFMSIDRPHYICFHIAYQRERHFVRALPLARIASWEVRWAAISGPHEHLVRFSKTVFRAF